MPFPNPDTQFKPGQSGNPKGAPKGNKHISTWIQEMLNDENFETHLLQGREYIPYKGAPLKAIIMTAQYKAVHGDEKAREWLAKYGWGTKLDLTTGGKPLPAPIFGGTANLPTDDGLQKDSEPDQTT